MEGQVRTRRETDRAMRTHVLEAAQRGTSQDTERNRQSEAYSPPGDRTGKDKSGHEKKLTEQGVLTSWRPQREEQARKMKRGRKQNTEGETDPRLIVTLFQQRATNHTVVLQLTQSDGKGTMQFFITSSVLVFPRANLGWVLEWDCIYLVLLCFA